MYFITTVLVLCAASAAEHVDGFRNVWWPTPQHMKFENGRSPGWITSMNGILFKWIINPLSLVTGIPCKNSCRDWELWGAESTGEGLQHVKPTDGAWRNENLLGRGGEIDTPLG